MSEQSAYQQNEETEQQISNHQKEKTMKAIDKSVPAYYAAGREYHRLRENIGLIEFERTKEIILENHERNNPRKPSQAARSDL